MSGDPPVPSPVVKVVVCSVCDEPWGKHNEPTILECVRLLKVRVDMGFYSRASRDEREKLYGPTSGTCAAP